MQDNLFNKNEIKLLKGNVPKFENIHPSLISILRAHSEINLSNLLVYFFKGEFKPRLKEIFLTALIDCLDIGKEDDRFLYDMLKGDLKDIEILPEYITNSGRIDILIINRKSRASEKSAIIIENKLYHEFNNDLDDYFYSVANNELIDPNNIAVALLSLKEIHSQAPSKINVGKILHSELKVAVKENLEHESLLLGDIKMSLLIDEYFQHIDDLHFNYVNPGNSACLSFYSAHRSDINKLAKVLGVGLTQQFNDASEENKRLLFEYQANISELITLHNDVRNFTLDYFDRYIKITERNVQGQDYFRGKGMAFNYIRYKSNLEEYLTESAPLGLQVSLNVTLLAQEGIDLDDEQLRTVFQKFDMTVPPSNINGGWVVISDEQYTADNQLVIGLIKDVLEVQWAEVEEVLVTLVKTRKVEVFNDRVRDFLVARNLEPAIIPGINSYIRFSYSATCAFVVYTIRFSPPDLVEITLFVEQSFWVDISEKIGPKESFILFSARQSYRIDEIKVDNLGVDLTYYPLFKRSFRIGENVDLNTILELERAKWIDIERVIVKMCEKPFKENLE